MSGTPIIVCGKTVQIGTTVIASAKPEYDVVHFVSSPEAGCAQIPLLLSGKEAPSDTELGSKNYSQIPIAVIAGGGYTTEEVATMKKASEVDGAKRVPWLHTDTTVSMPPPGPEYAKRIAERLKSKLAELQEKNQLGDGEIVLF